MDWRWSRPRGIARGFDVEAPISVRSFFYLPLTHSEDALDQAGIVRLTSARTGSAEKHSSPLRGPPLRSDRPLRTVSARNAALGRESTAEEIEFLKTNPIDF